MTSQTHDRPWPWLAAPLLAAALVLGAWALVPPASAGADELSDLQAQVEESAQALEEAEEAVAQLEEQIAANQERIAQIEADLPEAQDDAATSMRTLYKLQQSTGSLIQLFFSADDFNELITLIQYLGIISDRSMGTIDELVEMQAELEATEAELEAELAEAEEAQAAAEEALAEAQAAREALQAELEAQAAAEEAERQAAIAAAAAALAAAAEAEAEAAAEAEEAAAAETTEETEADEEAETDEDSSTEDDSTSEDSSSSSATFTTESGTTATIEVPSSSSASAVDWSLSEEEFVAEWTARIDAYLAGSPLSGYGSVFAEAAWTYGVDPRFSPAISCVESSKGRYCYRSYNAWGWGKISWSSWEEAIWAHVKGLANGYGGTLTYAGAQKYCPSNAAYWYSTVLAEMEKI